MQERSDYRASYVSSEFSFRPHTENQCNYHFMLNRKIVM